MMNSKERDDEERLMNRRRDELLELQEKIEKAISKLQASGSSTSTLHKLQYLSKKIQQQLLNTTTRIAQDPSEELSQIHDELDKWFVLEEVGHSCDLCHIDLATDPERPNAPLHSLQEANVLSCGHVYHSKCLRGATPDLDNHSSDPSCIFCISNSN